MKWRKTNKNKGIEYSHKKLYKYLLSILSCGCFFYSCANMGQGPQGGPYDFDPPQLQRSIPANNQTNFDGNKITLFFNKNVQIKDASQRIIVTPPQNKMPLITSANRKITVTLRDTLMQNTTYVIDFSDAIQDYNEGNPIDNFSVAFSTGETIDSLQVKGTVILAKDNEPLKGYFVGLHSNLNDSAFTTLPFQRISRTNEQGQFTIKGVAPGKYRIFALEDKGRDYMYTNPSEIIAFGNEIIEPVMIIDGLRQDTIYSFKKGDHVHIDIIKEVPNVKYLPDNLILRAFRSAERRQYFRNAVRSNAERFELNFGSETEVPVLEPLNFSTEKKWDIPERNLIKDSIYMYWLTEQSLIDKDTLQFKMTYYKTDSLNVAQLTTDTILVVNRNRRKNEEKKKKKIKENEEEEIITFLAFKNNLTSSFNIYDTINIEFGEPVVEPFKSFIRLQIKPEGDTIYNEVDYTLTQNPLNPRKYSLWHKWDYSENYRIEMDSAKIFSIYGLYANKWVQDFKIKSQEEYANLIFTLEGITSDVSWIMQLLNDKGDPVRQIMVRQNNAVFKNVLPGKYYARVIRDDYHNKEWTTGNYYKNEQPDPVFYFPEMIELRPYWDDEEVFIVDTLSISKPLDILKNKPQDKTERQKKLEQRDAELNAQKKKAESNMNNMNNAMKGNTRY